MNTCVPVEIFLQILNKTIKEGHPIKEDEPIYTRLRDILCDF